MAPKGLTRSSRLLDFPSINPLNNRGCCTTACISPIREGPDMDHPQGVREVPPSTPEAIIVAEDLQGINCSSHRYTLSKEPWTGLD